MNQVNKLPKGIPAGYKPQTQDVKPGAHVMVSEYTRRIAHELDDLHRAWIMRHIVDQLAYIDASPFANENAPLRHLDWMLNHFDKAEDKYQEVVERRLWLQNELGNMRRSRKIDGKFWHKNQFLDHYEALKHELLYCSVLQARLKAMSYALQDYTKSVRREEKEKKLEQFGKSLEADGGVLAVLVELRGELVDWLSDNSEIRIPEGLRRAIGRSREAISALSVSCATEETSSSGDHFVILDGFFVRRSELMDVKLKGNALSQDTWIPKDDAE